MHYVSRSLRALASASLDHPVAPRVAMHAPVGGDVCESPEHERNCGLTQLVGALCQRSMGQASPVSKNGTCFKQSAERRTAQPDDKPMRAARPLPDPYRGVVAPCSEMLHKVTEINFLHFTDLHVGMEGLATDWPTIRHRLETDLKFLCHESGPWDLVIFTGDLAFSGANYQFARVSEILSELWGMFAELGCDPPPRLVTVPGNHDMTFPETDSHAYGLHRNWDYGDIRSRFWSTDTDPRRTDVMGLSKNTRRGGVTLAYPC